MLPYCSLVLCVYHVLNISVTRCFSWHFSSTSAWFSNILLLIYCYSVITCIFAIHVCWPTCLLPILWRYINSSSPGYLLSACYYKMSALDLYDSFSPFWTTQISQCVEISVRVKAIRRKKTRAEITETRNIWRRLWSLFPSVGCTRCDVYMQWNF